jgi:hypothetical protein
VRKTGDIIPYVSEPQESCPRCRRLIAVNRLALHKRSRVCCVLVSAQIAVNFRRELTTGEGWPPAVVDRAVMRLARRLLKPLRRLSTKLTLSDVLAFDPLFLGEKLKF